MSESTAVVSIEDQIRQQLALQQEKMSQMQVGANLISFKGGQLIVDGTPVPGGEAEVIVLAQQGERSYYEGTYDPSKPQVPACYSFDGEKPHPEATDPQNATCEGCPQNEWGSKGRGKACREGARVAVLPASAPLDRRAIEAAGVTRYQLANCAWRQAVRNQAPTGRFFLLRCGPEGESLVYTLNGSTPDNWEFASLDVLEDASKLTAEEAYEIIRSSGQKANDFTLLCAQ